MKDLESRSGRFDVHFKDSSVCWLEVTGRAQGSLERLLGHYEVTHARKKAVGEVVRNQ